MARLKLIAVAMMCFAAAPGIAADSLPKGYERAIVKRQYGKAATLLLPSAEAGNAEAQYRLGMLYRLGLGAGANDARARAWLERAAAGGHSKAGRILTLWGQSVSTAPVRGALGDSPLIDWSARDQRGLTWLMRAAARDKIDAKTPLLSPDESDSEGATALIWAARFGGPDTVTRLVEAGASATAPASNGETPQTAAARTGKTEALAALLAAGAARPEPAALFAAASRCNVSAAEALSTAGAPQTADKNGVTPLLALVRNCSEADFTGKLVERGALAAKDAMGRGPVWYAARNGQPATVAKLAVADADFVTPDRDGMTPLMAAAKSSQGGAVKALLDLGAPVTGHTADANTAAMLAAASSCIDCLRALAPFLKPVDERNALGETALMLAVKAGSADAAGLLIKAGARPDARDNRRDTPRKLAKRAGLSAILALMN
jgi:ankyrin repeat protein